MIWPSGREHATLRSASVLVASTTIWTMSAKTSITTRSSKCWATGLSLTTLRFLQLKLLKKLTLISTFFFFFLQKEAIGMAMELLIEVYQLDKNRLYATYFEGNPKAGLDPDLEAKEYWKQ